MATNKRRVWLHYNDDLGIASSREAILAFIRLARSGRIVPPPGRTPRLVLDVLSASDNQALHDATLASGNELSRDLEGFRRFIFVDGVTHAFNSHGPGSESVNSQIPISPESISMYLDVIADPDRVEFNPNSLSFGNNDALIYSKQIDGRLVVVEEVMAGDKNRALSFHSMFIQTQRP